jgi:hypothetical protein
MPFFSNKRKDFSIQPPKQEVSSIPFFVTDSSNIDFTFLNNNLTADLTLTGVVAGTYGDASNIPVLQIDQWGRITGVTLVPVSGGGGTYTVNNGLTENPANNFQLGGTLIQDTVINNVGFYSLFTGALSSGTSTGILRAENSGSSPSFRANNSGTGNAIRATSNSGIAAFIQSASSIAGYFFSTTARGIYSESYGSYGGTISRLDVSQTGVLGVLEVFRGSTGGAGLNNIGGSIDFKLAASNGGAILNNASRLISILTDTNLLSLTSRFSINNINNLVNEEQFYILGSGQIGFNKYGVGTFLATPAYALGVDAFGDVVEFTTSPTTGDSISPFLLMGG